MEKSTILFDKANSFGWISIALHWATAVIVILLWFIGLSISYQSGDAADARRLWHVGLGLTMWVVLVGRIGWRLYCGHPKALGQSATTHRAAQVAHYGMLALLAVLLVSGPVMAWAMLWAEPPQISIVNLAFWIHSSAAITLSILVLLHFLAALKHLMFDDDETLARIFVPRKND